MITAVAFDLWETLITETPEISREQERLRLRRIEEILSARGYGRVADRIEDAYRSLWTRCHELYWSNDRDVPCRTQIEHFLEALGESPSTFSDDALAEIEAAYAGAAVDVLPRTVDFAIDLLQQLKRDGFAIGLVSNTGRTPGTSLRRVLEKLGAGALIDVMVFSNETGVCKPQRAIFETVREGLDRPWNEIAFVGDNIHADVFGAQQCGMYAVHFVPPIRGTAIAAPVDHGLTIVPDAVIRSLRDLPDVLASASSRAGAVS